MTPRWLATLFLGSFTLAIFALQWWQQTSYPWWTLLILLPCLRWRWWLSISLGVLLALMAVMRTTHLPNLNTIDWYATGEPVQLEGTIAAEPDRRPMQTKYTIEVDTLVDGSGTIIRGLEGLVLATDRRQWPLYHYGDHVSLRGALERPEPIEDFHYDRYLSRYNIHAIMYRSSLAISESQPYPEPKLSVIRSLFSLKEHFERQINRLYPEPHASFMAGLLTGSRRGIPQHLLEDFNTTGLTHIIAISGYNITIVITMISGLLFWLPLRWRLVPAVIAIIGFTVFVGASAAVIRAAIMGILGLLAIQAGRLSNARLAVLWTLFVMLVWNPKYLWYDAGFQLSFLAVIGLMEIGPTLDRFFQWAPDTLAIRESLQMTIAAQLSAVPLIVLLFGRLSLIAPIANLLVAPFVPLAMLCGAIGTVLSFISVPLGQLPAFLGFGCLQWIILVTKWCAAVPGASIDLQLGTIGLILYYCCLLIWLTNDRVVVVVCQIAKAPLWWLSAADPGTERHRTAPSSPV